MNSAVTIGAQQIEVVYRRVDHPSRFPEGRLVVGLEVVETIFVGEILVAGLAYRVLTFCGAPRSVGSFGLVRLGLVALDPEVRDEAA